MFDVILDRIKECVPVSVHERAYLVDEESVIVKIEPQAYDGTVCRSTLKIVCIAKDYESALTSFDSICEGLDSLCDEDNEVLDISLNATAIKYDTASGMTRMIGTFTCYTEVSDGGID